MLKKFIKDMTKDLKHDIAIDFGTASVLVFVDGKDIVLKEPSMVAVDVSTDRVVKVGRDAMELQGRTPEHIETLRPMKDGSISQYDVTLQMLKYFIRRASGKTWLRPRVMITVPSDIKDMEISAMMEAAREAGAGRTYLIEEAKAAAIGADLDVFSAEGSMIVNIGGGMTDVAVLSMGGIVISESIRVGGDQFDEAIVSYIRRRYGILISERTAEDIKIRIGDVYEHKKPLYMRVSGRSLSEGTPKEVVISSKETIEAVMEPLTAIMDSIFTIIRNMPKELFNEISQRGMILTGGGSMLHGLDKLITLVTNVPAHLASRPITSAVLGAGKLLPYLDKMPEGMVNLPAKMR